MINKINVVDGIGIWFMLYYCYLKYKDLPPELRNDEAAVLKWTQDMSWIVSLATFWINIRAIYYFRVFSKRLRSMMAVIDGTF